MKVDDGKLNSNFVLYSKIENYCLITLKIKIKQQNTEKVSRKIIPKINKFSLFLFTLQKRKKKKKRALSFPLLSLSLLHKTL